MYYIHPWCHTLSLNALIGIKYMLYSLSVRYYPPSSPYTEATAFQVVRTESGCEGVPVVLETMRQAPQSVFISVSAIDPSPFCVAGSICAILK